MYRSAITNLKAAPKNNRYNVWKKTHFRDASKQGCQIYLVPNIPNWTTNLPNGHKLYQSATKYTYIPLKGPPKFTQFWIFGLKTNHLATLLQSDRVWQRASSFFNKFVPQPSQSG
jgi:hypothetical protein